MSVKSRILDKLEASRGSSVSGQLLADELGVSRAAVWKGIQALRADGYAIEATTNKGYLLRESGRLSAAAVRSNRAAAYADMPVEVHDVLDSTNMEAKRLAMTGAPHGTLVLAEQQTEGRGRRGKRFFSPAGTGLYMSLLLRMEAKPGEAYRFTLAAAVAARKALREVLGVETGIKWVNDLMIGDRKAAGVLTEAVTDFETGLTELVIIGIGVNLNPPKEGFPQELSGIAAALTDAPADRNRLAARIADELLCVLEWTPETLLSAYREGCMLLGRQITFERNGTCYAGTAVDVLADGSLLVRLENGEEMALHSGEVSVRANAV